MDIVKIGASLGIIGGAAVAGNLMGASWIGSTLFVCTDIIVWANADRFMGFVMPSQVPFLNLTRFVAASVIGYFAGLYLNRIPFGKENDIKWTQAVFVHIVTVVAVFAYGAIISQKELKLALKTTSL